MSELFLALDAGTQACKAMVFDVEGGEVSRAVVPYVSEYPQPGWAEIDPRKLFEAATAVIRAAVRDVEATRLAAVGVSAQLGLAAVDENGIPLGDLLTWMDKRATLEADAIRAKLGEAVIYKVAGRRVDPEWPACQVLWLKENEPATYARVHKFLSIKDLLVHQLTGQLVTDETHASYTLLYNVEERRWQTEFLEALDIDSSKLPEVRSAQQVSGEVTREASVATGLPSGLPVIVGGPDGTVGAVGAGLVRPGAAVNIVGTTDVIFTCGQKATFDPTARTLVNCHAIDGLWGLGGPMGFSGGCVQWFADHVACSTPDALDAEAAEVPPGAEHLLCLPSLVGERVPGWNSAARGAFFGLTPSHRRGHLHRAILEGAAFAAKRVFDLLEEQGARLDVVHLAGGGAQSELWSQVRADVYDKSVVIPQTKESTCLGTAMLAGVAVGMYDDFAHAYESVFRVAATLEPNPAHRDIYDALYEEHRRLARLVY